MHKQALKCQHAQAGSEMTHTYMHIWTDTINTSSYHTTHLYLSLPYSPILPFSFPPFPLTHSLTHPFFTHPPHSLSPALTLSLPPLTNSLLRPTLTFSLRDNTLKTRTHFHIVWHFSPRKWAGSPAPHQQLQATIQTTQSGQTTDMARLAYIRQCQLTAEKPQGLSQPEFHPSHNSENNSIYVPLLNPTFSLWSNSYNSWRFGVGRENAGAVVWQRGNHNSGDVMSWRW